MSFRRTAAVARKEFLHIVRDRRSLALALALPALMLLLFGYALSLDVDRIPTLIYDADRSPQSRELIAGFESSRFFRVAGFVNRYLDIEQAFDRDEALLGVVIDQHYSADLLAVRKGKVQLLLDGSDSNTASIALGYAESLLRVRSTEISVTGFNRRAGAQLKSPVEAQPRVWYNAELKSKNYIVPGLVGVILMVIAALLTSLTIAREWEMGTMEQLLSTPVRPPEIVLGKMSAFFTVGAADSLIAILAGVLVFDVPMRGSAVFLAATTAIFLVAALCWGILVSAVARSQLLAFQIGILSTFLPAFLLSGFVYAIDTMPEVIQVITRIVLARYFVTIVKGVFLKGVGMEVLGLEVALLTAFAVVVFFAATRKLRAKLG